MPIDREEPVYMIGVAARLCAMHPQTLRLYERIGLIRPTRISAKNRLYSQADIERLQQIQRLTHELGVNLAGVEVILDLLDKMQRMHDEMEHRMAELRHEMEQEMVRRLRDLQGR